MVKERAYDPTDKVQVFRALRREILAARLKVTLDEELGLRPRRWYCTYSGCRCRRLFGHIIASVTRKRLQPDRTRPKIDHALEDVALSIKATEEIGGKSP